MKKLCLAALAAVSLLGCSDTKEEEKTTEKAAEPVRGVTDTEIKLGGMHDLSGVFAAFSSPAVQVANDMFDEVNAEGGIHGRKIRYIVEDHAYQVPKATQAVNKLVTRDEVFAMLMSLGGSLYGHHYNYIEAQTFNVLLSIYILLYVLMGGTQTAWGPLIGATFFAVVPETLREIAESAGLKWLAEGRFILFGVFIVLLMVFRPEGVMTRTLQDRLGGGLFQRKKAVADDTTGGS